MGFTKPIGSKHCAKTVLFVGGETKDNWGCEVVKTSLHGCHFIPKTLWGVSSKLRSYSSNCLWEIWSGKFYELEHHLCRVNVAILRIALSSMYNVATSFNTIVARKGALFVPSVTLSHLPNYCAITCFAKKC